VRRVHGRTLSIVVAIALAFAASCSQDAELQQHREKFESLGASTGAIAEAWLAGTTSDAYTASALQQTFQLVEKERQALAAKPDALADPRGAELSQLAERLSRLIAAMLNDVRGADAASVRQRLTAIPIVPSHSS
jgi:hypothetical protein